MRKVLVIASREYQAAVRTKAFLIGLLVLPVMMGGSIIVQMLLKDKVDLTEKPFALIDRTPGQQLLPHIQSALEVRNNKQIYDPDKPDKQIQPKFEIEAVAPSADSPEARAAQRHELSERVRKGKLFGFAEIGRDVLTPVPAPVGKTAPLPKPKGTPGQGAGSEVPDEFALLYQSNSPTYDTFSRWLHGVVNEKVKDLRGRKAGLEPDKLKEVLQPVALNSRNLEGKDENPVLALLMPGGLLILMFMMILLGATPLVQSVVEEKMQRIAEVLLGSVPPFQLMMGKLLGMAGVSLTLTACYLGGALWAAHHYDVAENLTPALLAWFLIFQALAVIMYGSVFIAIGAACTDMRETQTLIWPVMLVACIPMFVWLNVVREPNGALALGLSYFPFSTPMVMVARQAVPPGIPWWQPALGVLLVLLTTVVCVYIAGRIFRVGILMQGKGAQVGELVRWVVRG
jgi:ABC-2 type transport system permease protein